MSDDIFWTVVAMSIVILAGMWAMFGFTMWLKARDEKAEKQKRLERGSASHHV